MNKAFDIIQDQPRCADFGRRGKGSPACIHCREGEECRTEKGLVDTPIFGLLPKSLVERHPHMTRRSVIPASERVNDKGQKTLEPTAQWKAFEKDAMAFISREPATDEELASYEAIQNTFGPIVEGKPGEAPF